MPRGTLIDHSYTFLIRKAQQVLQWIYVPGKTKALRWSNTAQRIMSIVYLYNQCQNQLDLEMVFFVSTWNSFRNSTSIHFKFMNHKEVLYSMFVKIWIFWGLYLSSVYFSLPHRYWGSDQRRNYRRLETGGWNDDKPYREIQAKVLHN